MTLEAMCAVPDMRNIAAAGHEFGNSNNEQLRALVSASMLPPAVAMTIFNRGMAALSACSETQWKRYLAEPSSERFHALPDELLAHAVDQFARIGVHHQRG